MNQEFLPLCDVLFNIISLVSYFCDLVFDVISVYTMYEQRRYAWFAVALLCVLGSLLASQLMSVTWYLRERREEQRIDARTRSCETTLVLAAHLLQCGVVWRYFALFIPVDLRCVKMAVRDLCLLRLTHAFFEAAPMLLIQLFGMWHAESVAEVTQLSVVSTALSLFSVCWALASFNKHLRPHNLHKLALTWLGVIYQFFWRLGTVSSRVAALTLYATRYHFWVFLVMALHWVTTFLWLLAQKNLFRGEKLSRKKRALFALLVSYVYVFCYVNLQEQRARRNMVAFYVVMFLENSLLATVWLGLETGSPWFKYFGAAVVWGGFAGGIIFMLLYYRYFHIGKLQSHVGGVDHHHHPRSTSNGCTACQLGTCSQHAMGDSILGGHTIGRSDAETKEYQLQRSAVNGDGNHNHMHHNNGLAYIPGVFNCRLNPALKRKKKKPTTFIPIPATTVRPITSPPVNGCKMAATVGTVNGTSGVRVDVPFWKRRATSAATVAKATQQREADAAVSRFNIQQKLREKKQQQLQMLRAIQQEIEQGKLERPAYLPDISEQGTLRQPIPRSKKQPWVAPGHRRHLHHHESPIPDCGGRALRSAPPPELLLSAHHLENARVYYDCDDEKWRFASSVDDGWPMSGLATTTPTPSGRENGPPSAAGNKSSALINGVAEGSGGGSTVGSQLYKSYRIQIPSDLDSQISLPRSYTLPREFRYHRKPKLRKPINSEHFVTSNNSNDGDVDSGEEYGGVVVGGGSCSENKKCHRNGFQSVGIVQRGARPGCAGSHSLTPCNLHETKL